MKLLLKFFGFTLLLACASFWVELSSGGGGSFGQPALSGPSGPSGLPAKPGASFSANLAGCLQPAAAQAAEAARPAAWAQPLDLPESDNFHKVTDDLYRSAQPSKSAMREYEKFGIKTVINLRGFHDDDEEAAGTSLKLVHIPIHTWQAGEEKNVIKILQAIRDAEKPVLVHCQHGADRTGLAVAMFRIVEQGWSKREALLEMREGGYGFHSIWKNIPEYIEEANVEAVTRALR